MKNKDFKLCTKIFLLTSILITILSYLIFFITNEMQNKNDNNEIRNSLVMDYTSSFDSSSKVETTTISQHELFNAKARKEVIDKINEIGNYNNEPDFIYKTKSEYTIQEKKDTAVTLSFTKLSKTKEETNSILEIYNKTNDDKFFTDTVMDVGLEYFIYKVDVEYSNEIENDFPVFLIVDENDKDFDGWMMQPYVLYYEKNSNSHYTYVMAFTKPSNIKSKVCMDYSPDYVSETEFICLPE